MERIEEVVSSSHVEHIFPDQTAMDGGEVRSTIDDAASVRPTPRVPYFMWFYSAVCVVLIMWAACT